MIDWLTDWLFLDCKTVRIFCEFKHARAVKSEEWVKTESETGERRACEAGAPCASESQAKPILRKNWLFSRLDFFLPMSHTCFAHLPVRLAHALGKALPGLAGCTVASGTPGDLARRLLLTRGVMTHARAWRRKSMWRQRYKVILKVTLFLYLLREVYLTNMQRILMNFAQTFCSTASTMKLLFSISLVSVCLFLVTARFVHFIHRQEIVEDLNARDDPAVTGLFDMPSRSSSKIYIASCGFPGMYCLKDSQCCSHHCLFPGLPLCR